VTASPPAATAAGSWAAPARAVAPGLLLAAGVALAAMAAAPLLAAALGWAFGLRHGPPAMVLALLIGIALSGVAARPVFREGLGFCAKKLLRFAVALLGLRIALGDVRALGLGTALLVAGSMAATIAAALWLARLLRREAGTGALAGAATAICGASATLAAAAALPAWRTKATDVAFTVVAANAFSTVAMLAYPALASALGLAPHETGVLLGATVHDMAQVVGAGYAVSPAVGDTAVVVKLFRVLLLLPAVLALGWWFGRGEGGGRAGGGAPAVPGFALAFVALCLLNSAMPVSGVVGVVWTPVRAALVEASSLGLLVAIAALGLGTSARALLGVGWRHLAVFAGASLVLLTIVAVAVSV
jgi:uncharacterized integral membrane protein (TIGR00698 family)